MLVRAPLACLHQLPVQGGCSLGHCGMQACHSSPPAPELPLSLAGWQEHWHKCAWGTLLQTSAEALARLAQVELRKMQRAKPELGPLVPPPQPPALDHEEEML